MIELSDRELGILAFCLFILGFLVCYLVIAYNIFIYEGESNKEIITAGEIYLKNITFKFEDKTAMKDALGTALLSREEGKFGTVTIRNNLTKSEFLRICNHEVIHLLFWDRFSNRTQEEEYVCVLQHYVRFPVCNELLEMVE